MALAITVSALKQREKLIDVFVADERFAEAAAVINDNLKQCDQVANANKTLAADDLLDALELARYLAIDPRLRNALRHTEKRHGLSLIIALRFALNVVSPREIRGVDIIALAITRRMIAALNGPRVAVITHPLAARVDL